MSGVDIGSPTAVEMGRRSGVTRRRREAAIKRIVAESRARQGLPPTVKDVAVLERLADLLAQHEEVGPDAAA